MKTGGMSSGVSSPVGGMGNSLGLGGRSMSSTIPSPARSAPAAPVRQIGAFSNDFERGVGSRFGGSPKSEIQMVKIPNQVNQVPPKFNPNLSDRYIDGTQKYALKKTAVLWKNPNSSVNATGIPEQNKQNAKIPVQQSGFEFSIKVPKAEPLISTKSVSEQGQGVKIRSNRYKVLDRVKPGVSDRGVNAQRNPDSKQQNTPAEVKTPEITINLPKEKTLIDKKSFSKQNEEGFSLKPERVKRFEVLNRVKPGVSERGVSAVRSEMPKPLTQEVLHTERQHSDRDTQKEVVQAKRFRMLDRVQDLGNNRGVNAMRPVEKSQPSTQEAAKVEHQSDRQKRMSVFDRIRPGKNTRGVNSTRAIENLPHNDKKIILQENRVPVAQEIQALPAPINPDRHAADRYNAILSFKRQESNAHQTQEAEKKARDNGVPQRKFDSTAQTQRPAIESSAVTQKRTLTIHSLPKTEIAGVQQSPQAKEVKQPKTRSEKRIRLVTEAKALMNSYASERARATVEQQYKDQPKPQARKKFEVSFKNFMKERRAVAKVVRTEARTAQPLVSKPEVRPAITRSIQDRIAYAPLIESKSTPKGAPEIKPVPINKPETKPSTKPQIMPTSRPEVLPQTHLAKNESSVIHPSIIINPGATPETQALIKSNAILADEVMNIKIELGMAPQAAQKDSIQALKQSFAKHRVEPFVRIIEMEEFEIQPQAEPESGNSKEPPMSEETGDRRPDKPAEEEKKDKKDEKFEPQTVKFIHDTQTDENRVKKIMSAVQKLKEKFGQSNQKKVKGAVLAKAIEEVPQTEDIKSKLVKGDKHFSDGSYAEVVRDIFNIGEITLEEGIEHTIKQVIDRHHAVTFGKDTAPEASDREVEKVVSNKNALVTIHRAVTV